MSWGKVKLGEVIAHRKEFITIDNRIEYKRCRVQVNRKGVVLRDVIKGVLINTKKQQVCKEGDFLVAEIDAKVGGYGFVPKELDGAIVSSHYFLFDVDERKMLKSYLAWIIKTGIIQEQINSKGSTNYAAIRPRHVLNFEIPLPSIKEQTILIERINNIDTEYLLLQIELGNQQGCLQQLRQAISQEAIQGKLTIQNKDDEPADKLLQRVKAEKKKLSPTAKLKKGKVLAPIAKSEMPFEIPNGWVWCRLGELNLEFQNGISTRNSLQGEETVVLRLADIKETKISLSETRKIKLGQSEITKYNLKADDILIIRVNGSPDIVGRFISISTENKLTYCDHFIRVRFINEKINSNYISLVANSKFARTKIEELFVTTAGQKTVNQGHISSLLIPLPPFAEQHRIVAKVQQLLQVVSQLEQQVVHSQKQAQQLLQAVLKEAFTSKGKVYEENEMITMAAED